MPFTLLTSDPGGSETAVPRGGEPFAIESKLRWSVDTLRDVTVTGRWAPDGTGYNARGTDVSSEILQPQHLPSNAGRIALELQHSYELGIGAGGNLKRSTDGGATWSVLEPSGGYGTTFEPQYAHPMRGETVFTGSTPEPAVASFDLAPYHAGQVRVRLALEADCALYRRGLRSKRCSPSWWQRRIPPSRCRANLHPRHALRY